jgi:hypothetical protein
MKTIEVFSAGCPACLDALDQINHIPGSKTVRVLDMRDAPVAARARELGVTTVPAVVVDGRLADCCVNRGIDPDVIAGAL